MKIGAGWVNFQKDQNGGKKVDQDGKPLKYLSCKIDLPFFGSLNFALFPNNDKKQDTHPDYNIVWSPQKNSGAPQSSPNDEPSF